MFCNPSRSGPPPATAFEPLTAVLLSLGQAIFSPNIWSGLLFAAGVLLSNWRHGVIAIFGAMIGTAVVLLLPRNGSGRRQFRPLWIQRRVDGGVGVHVVRRQARLSILGALLATILTPAVAVFGVQTLSAPFVFTTWLMLGLGWVEDHWFAVPPAPASSAANPPDLVRRRSRVVLTWRMIDDYPMTAPITIPNLLDPGEELRESGDWQPFRPGVTAQWLYNEGDGGPAAVLLRYEPGARVASMNTSATSTCSSSKATSTTKKARTRPAA